MLCGSPSSGILSGMRSIARDGLHAPRSVARSASLHYVDRNEPGITRTGRGVRATYRYPDGRVVPQRVRTRIERLAIPPAWKKVWICSDPLGHLQATGMDAKGRTQYLYHPRWQEEANDGKFHKLPVFGTVLPEIRSTVRRMLLGRTPTREWVLAGTLYVMDRLHVRVGNEESASDAATFGVTTLRHRHARVRRDDVTLRFRAKGGLLQEFHVHDPRLARIIRACQHLPGQFLFEYEEDGACAPVHSDDVNAFLQSIAGEEFTAKDFRTWHGSATFFTSALAAREGGAPPRDCIRTGVADASEALRNTKTLCRQYYIHPTLITWIEEEKPAPALAGSATARRWLTEGERRMLAAL